MKKIRKHFNWKIPVIRVRGKKFRAVDYRINREGTIRRRDGKIMSVYKSSSGYMLVSLSLNKKRHTFLFHRLLWETFVGEIPKGKEINHKDGIKGNNDLENLELMTHKENMKHAFENGLSGLFSKVTRKRMSNAKKGRKLS